MSYQPITKDKVCNWTFVKESDLPEGEKLLGCSRCRECWYKDRECQTKHWPYHKKSCRSIAEEPSEALHINIPSIEFCAKIIVATMEKIHHLRITGGRMLLHAFRELQRLLIEEGEDPQSDPEEAIRDIAEAFADCSKLNGRDILLDIWAIPGWSSYFLSDDLLLSPEMKRRKDLGIPARQQLQAETAAEDSCLSISYPRMFFSVYSYSASELKEDGQEIPVCQDDLSAALIRRFNSAWASEYVRESLPKNNEFLLQTFVSTFALPFYSNMLQKHCRPDELAPGLTAKQLLTILMKHYDLLHGMEKEDRSQLLEEIYTFGAYFEDNKHLPWSHLTAKDRIELLDMSHDWDAPKKKITLEQPPAEFFTNIRTCVLHMITGCQTKILLEMYYLCQTMSPPPDERTVQMIKKIRNAMLVQYLPKVAIYSEMMEPKARAKGTDQSFPDVLNPLIAEFSFGHKYIWASDKRKGLRFLTESEIEQQHRMLRYQTAPLRKMYKENVYDNTPGVPVYDDDEASLTWAQVERKQGQPADGFLDLEVVKDESSMERQVFQCRDCDGVTRRVAAYTSSGRIPGLSLGTKFSWGLPHIHYFMDGSIGGRIEDEDLMNFLLP
jgi:hypothetical protein